MDGYPSSAVARAMKVQEVIVRAASGQIQWWHATEILRQTAGLVAHARQRGPQRQRRPRRSGAAKSASTARCRAAGRKRAAAGA